MSEFMRTALVEAGRAVESVYPYPGVGVVIVLEGRIIVRARNGSPGSPHAEILAIMDAKRGSWPLKNTTLYTNLEPCCNLGIAPACTEEIIQSGIPEIHVAIEDPYHLVRGKGFQTLRDAGVKVVIGEMGHEARWQNQRYLARFCPHCGWPIKD